MEYGSTRRSRKQSGQNPPRVKIEKIVGETVKEGLKEWNTLKDAQLRKQYGPNIWEEGFSKGIDKIVEFSKKSMDGYYNHTKYPGKPHFSDNLTNIWQKK